MACAKNDDETQRTCKALEKEWSSSPGRGQDNAADETMADEQPEDDQDDMGGDESGS